MYSTGFEGEMKCTDVEGGRKCTVHVLKVKESVQYRF